MQASEKLDELLPVGRVWVLAGVGAAIIFGGVLWLSFSGTPELPAKPPPPRAADTRDLRKLDWDPDVWRGYIEKDATTYGVPAPSAEVMTGPFPYEKSEAPRRLAPGGEPITLGMLRLGVKVEKIELRNKKGLARAEHLVLRIENLTDAPVAYRVATSLGRATDTMCGGKAIQEHNAVAIPPGGVVERVECVYRDNMELQVTAVEAMQLPELSFHYVSRLYPEHIGVEGRVAAGHHAPKGELCKTIPQQLIMIGMQNGSVSWRDVVDFYARHRCETYDFPDGYTAIVKPGQLELPAGPHSFAR
jgi:hypothetical protein